MREILFRGKRLDNGEWAEGSLLSVTTVDGTNYKLIFSDAFSFNGGDVVSLAHGAVAPETVGQYTGLKDKNGKRIFEGDIVRFERFGSWHTGKVVFNPRTAGFEVWWEIIVGAYGEKATRTMNMAGSAFYKEIIGNIHDNPELLKEAE